jgi:hypothetical protein
MPLAIDLFCGLGGWAEGFLAEGYDVVGFDIERHDYGTGSYPGQLVIQNILTLHGYQLKNAAVIVASPPCQEFSYMAMPWKRAKQIAHALQGQGEFPEGYKGSHTEQQLTELFNVCFCLQQEASEAAGRHIPLIVENVCGAQRWVGRAKWHYGSYYLWGDVPALMPISFAQKHNPDGTGHPPGSWFAIADSKNRGAKIPASCSERRWKDRPVQRLSDAVAGTKQGGEWWHDPESLTRRHSSKSIGRKAASAEIAKIPFPLAQHIARVFKEERKGERLLPKEYA